jgi:hypothetical protein
MQRVLPRASVATRVTLSGRNFGRASERFVSERPQYGEREMTRAVGPATERVKTCHGDHSRHGAGHVQRRVTAPGREPSVSSASVTFRASGPVGTTCLFAYRPKRLFPFALPAQG